MTIRTALTATAVLVAAAGTTTVLILHPGEPAAAAQPATRPAPITYAAHDEPGNEAFDDLGAASPNGPDIGDVLAFTQRLTIDGTTVGQVHVAAIGVDHTRHLSQINATIVLPGGDLEIAGIVPMTPTFTLAVTGGTGQYVGESGTVSFGQRGQTQTLTVRLTH